MAYEMSVEKYLARIGYKGGLEPSAVNLAALQKAHLMSVPYENLDLYFHIETTLALPEVYDKIVNRHRGGYCFELNGLFGWLLRQLGYKTEEYFGRWLLGESIPVPQRRHRIINVAIGDKRYIADVGIGRKCPLTPLEFVCDMPQNREGVNYRIVKDPALFNVVQAEHADGYASMFSFDEAPQENVDFTYPHFYCSHYPQSPFLTKIMVFLNTANGRNSFSTSVDPQTGAVLPMLSVGQPGGGNDESFIYSAAQLSQCLKQYFGIEIDVPEKFHC